MNTPLGAEVILGDHELLTADRSALYFFGCALGGKILFSRKYIAAVA